MTQPSLSPIPLERFSPFEVLLEFIKPLALLPSVSPQGIRELVSHFIQIKGF